MDVYLTREAMGMLKALSFLSPAAGEGFLIGHQRGNRRLVEKVLPTIRGFFPTVESFAESNRVLRGGVVGFFSFKPGKDRLKRILAPFACESVFVDASGLKAGRGNPKAFVIEFDRTFKLRPVACIVEKGNSRE